jgi:hypothetical protein
MRVIGLLQPWQTGSRRRIGAARVDAHHQVEALERGVFGVRQADRAGIVDVDVDPDEAIGDLLDRLLHCDVIPDIDEQR